MVELAPEVTDDGENPTVVPVGRPVAVSPTVWALPEMVAVLMVQVADDPASAEPEVGEAMAASDDAVDETQPGSIVEDVPAHAG